jgi:flagella basal body P-ring formation protein FlgA
LHGRGAEYPPSIDDVVGRALKKDVAINTIVTCQILEDPVVIKRGEIVDIVAENKEIIVQTKGRTVDKGKMGDMIRVRNMASGKEIQARVTANNAVTVEF